MKLTALSCRPTNRPIPPFDNIGLSLSLDRDWLIYSSSVIMLAWKLLKYMKTTHFILWINIILFFKMINNETFESLFYVEYAQDTNYTVLVTRRAVLNLVCLLCVTMAQACTKTWVPSRDIMQWSELLLLHKAKRQYMLTCKVSRYCLLALHVSIVLVSFWSCPWTEHHFELSPVASD